MVVRRRDFSVVTYLITVDSDWHICSINAAEIVHVRVGAGDTRSETTKKRNIRALSDGALY